MNKRGWLAVAWLGVLASTGASAGSDIGGETVKASSTFDRPTTVAIADNVSYAGPTTPSGHGAQESSKMPVGEGLLSFDSSAGTGNTYGALILAALGALAISATRRRTR